MPTSRHQTLRRFVNRVLNPLVRPFIAWVPGFSLVAHRGRRTGRVHRTPMLAFRHDGEVAFALTYGPEVDWVRNVLAAGECELIVRGRRTRLVEPRVVTDPSRRLVPPPVRVPLRVLGVDEFLVLRPAAAGTGGEVSPPGSR